MSIETYEQILENIRMDETIAEAKYKSGVKLLDAKDDLSSLKRKYFD